MIDITAMLGGEADKPICHVCKGVPKNVLHIPGSDFVDLVMATSDRKPSVLRNLQALYNHGRLVGSGYLSMLPVDQGVEHSAGASFAPNPMFIDHKNITRLAIEGGCNAVSSTLGVLGIVATALCTQNSFLS